MRTLTLTKGLALLLATSPVLADPKVDDQLYCIRLIQRTKCLERALSDGLRTRCAEWLEQRTPAQKTNCPADGRGRVSE